MNVLIIEDERSLSHEIEIYLTKQGFHCDVAFTGSKASELVAVNSYDFVLLDIGLPDTNGFEILKEAKGNNVDSAFIVLTARSETDDKIHGLDLGADDYLAKPFSFNEFLARIKALNRRNNLVSESQKIITIGNFEINFDTVAAFRDGKNLDLTKKEFRLLEYFVLNQGKVLSKSEIAEKVWDVDFDTGTNVVEVYVNYLRNKIDKGFDEKMIQTKFGLGYVFNPK